MQCNNHHQPYKFICYTCNNFMCSRCILNHHKQNPDHLLHCDHSLDIKQSLSNIFKHNNINNNKEDSSEFIIQSVKSMWNTLKYSSLFYQSILSKETKTISQLKSPKEFTQQEIILLKKIKDNKNSLEAQSTNIINNIKYLNTIKNDINLINNLKNNPNIINSNHSYSIESIMKSININQTLQTFINNNRQTLFNENNNSYDIKDLIKQYNNDSDSIILHLIMKYNNIFNKSDFENNSNNDFNFEVMFDILSNSLDWKSIFSESLPSYKSTESSRHNKRESTSIKTDLSSKQPPSKVIRTDSSSAYSFCNENKQLYIFTSHREMGATLINTSNNNSIEQLKIDFNFIGTFQSTIAIGEFIYVFGGFDNPLKWIKYSVKSKSIVHFGDIIGIDGDHFISVCYDGQDHIYLVNGYNVKNRIDRFNIKTMKFEKYHQFPKPFGRQLSTMIKDKSLYSISYHNSLMIEFNLENKTTKEHRINISPNSACHDNNGNFYIHSFGENAEFIRYDVKTKQTSKLNPIPAKFGNAHIQYQKVSSNESYIYSFGGTNFKNFKYSIERNQSQPLPFLENDKFERFGCGTQSISI